MWLIVVYFLTLEDWHYRHAALMAISAVGEGCEKQMTPILGEVVAAVLPFCQDQVRREGGRKSWRQEGGEWEGGGRGDGRGGVHVLSWVCSQAQFNLIMCRPEIKSHVRIQ